MEKEEENQPQTTTEENKEESEETKEEATTEKDEEAKEEESIEANEKASPKKNAKKNQKKDKKQKKRQEDDVPDFERVEDHHFEIKEEVYMIDPNGFDLWEGIVEKVEGDNYSIHYPDYPQDDETVEGTDRILVRTDKNKEIYNKQEEIRLKKTEEANGSEEENENE